MLNPFKQLIAFSCLLLCACNNNHQKRITSLMYEEFGYSIHNLKIIKADKSTFSIDSYYLVDFTVDSIEFNTLLSILTIQNKLKHFDDSVWCYENTIGETSKVYIAFYKTNHLISYNKIDE